MRRRSGIRKVVHHAWLRQSDNVDKFEIKHHVEKPNRLGRRHSPAELPRRESEGQEQVTTMERPRILRRRKSRLGAGARPPWELMLVALLKTNASIRAENPRSQVHFILSRVAEKALKAVVVKGGLRVSYFYASKTNVKQLLLHMRRFSVPRPTAAKQARNSHFLESASTETLQALLWPRYGL